MAIRLKLVYYRWGNTKHILGKPGPRGGKKTVCGKRVSNLNGHTPYYNSYYNYSRATQLEEKWFKVKNLNGICPRCRKGMFDA